MEDRTSLERRRSPRSPLPGRFPLAWALRALLAACLLVSAGVHGWLWYAWAFRDIAVIGPAFMVNAVAGLLIGAAVLLWEHWLPLVLAVGFGAATFGAFVVSATVGLFGVHEPWWGGWQMTANVAEVAAVLVGAILLQPYASGPARGRGRARHRAG